MSPRKGQGQGCDTPKPTLHSAPTQSSIFLPFATRRLPGQAREPGVQRQKARLECYVPLNAALRPIAAVRQEFPERVIFPAAPPPPPPLPPPVFVGVTGTFRFSADTTAPSGSKSHFLCPASRVSHSSSLMCLHAPFPEKLPFLRTPRSAPGDGTVILSDASGPSMDDTDGNGERGSLRPRPTARGPRPAATEPCVASAARRAPELFRKPHFPRGRPTGVHRRVCVLVQIDVRPLPISRPVALTSRAERITYVFVFFRRL